MTELENHHFAILNEITNLVVKPLHEQLMGEQILRDESNTSRFVTKVTKQIGNKGGNVTL